MKTVEQRLESLEKSARRYRLATVVLALVIVAGVTMGQTGSDISDVVKTRRVEVYDDAGNMVVLIANTEHGGMMGVSNVAGEPKVAIANTERGGAVEISNKTGESIVTLSADEYGNGVVGAWDRKGKGRTLKPGP